MHRFFFFFLFLLYSCSGYRFKSAENPLAIYGIKSVSIPMFLNRTPFAHVSGPFSKEFFSMLSRYRNLKVYAGDTTKTDAVLIGVISSEQKIKDAVKTENTIFTEDIDEINNNLSDERNPFYVPRQSKVTLYVRIILIKDPTHLELKAAESNVNKFMQKNSKIIFNEFYKVDKTFTRSVFDSNTLDSGGSVNFTQNHASLQRAIEDLASSAANNFQGLVLDAF